MKPLYPGASGQAQSVACAPANSFAIDVCQRYPVPLMPTNGAEYRAENPRVFLAVAFVPAIRFLEP